MIGGITLLDRVLSPRRPPPVYVIVFVDLNGHDRFWTGDDWTGDRRLALEIEHPAMVQAEKRIARRGAPSQAIDVRYEESVR